MKNHVGEIESTGIVTAAGIGTDEESAGTVTAAGCSAAQCGAAQRSGLGRLRGNMTTQLPGVSCIGSIAAGNRCGQLDE
eukprot:4585472-Pleurochrysis_carterae.AAC.1